MGQSCISPLRNAFQFAVFVGVSCFEMILNSRYFFFQFTFMSYLSSSTHSKMAKYYLNQNPNQPVSLPLRNFENENNENLNEIQNNYVEKLVAGGYLTGSLLMSTSGKNGRYKRLIDVIVITICNFSTINQPFMRLQVHLFHDSSLSFFFFLNIFVLM